MRILGIETSCDETAAAIVENGENIISNVVASSLPIHAETGGIVPERAAREQIKYIIPTIKESLKSLTGDPAKQIDAIALTVGPGLIGSLLVGIETAKALAYIWQKPIIPVNHLIGHIYANFIREDSKLKSQNSKLNKIEFPAIALVVSGGHTDLVLMKDHGKLKWLGGTRDDAAGEALDKIGRLLGLPYPGGPEIEKMAKSGNPKSFNFPRPMINSDDYDFSFSGLKTAVMRHVILRAKPEESDISDVSASVQQAIIDVLVSKTVKAAREFNAKSILLSGGVAANEELRSKFKVQSFGKAQDKSEKLKVKLFAPQKNLCTDNAAMIAAAAFFNYKPAPWQKITANPELHF